jgi:hypothetical protein
LHHHLDRSILAAMPQSLAKILVHTAFFGWQNGYGMFSLGASQIEDVRRHIAEQEQHHRQL